MKTLRTKVKSLNDIWKVDKKLLAGCETKVGGALDYNFPTEKLLYSFMLKRTELFVDPPNPIELTSQIVGENAEKRIVEIENTWKAKFKEKPRIEVHGSVKYLMRISELEDETNARAGYGPKCLAPPTFFYSACHNILLLPNNFLARQQRVKNSPGALETSVYQDNWVTSEFLWNSPYFEIILTDALAKALFRELRGEQKEGYVDMARTSGINTSEIIKLNEALALYTTQQLALNQHPEWGFHVMTDKIIFVWGNSHRRANFLGVDSLSDKKTLAQIAMLDVLKADEKASIVYYDFFTSHPRFKEKSEIFRGDAK